MLIKETWGNYLRGKFEENLDSLAIIDKSQNERYTYGELMIKSESIEKAFIGYGVTRGTHVALVLPGGAGWITTFLALINIGAIAVCLNNDTTDLEIRDRLLYSDSKIVITDEETYGKIKLHEEEIGLDLAVIVGGKDRYSEGICCDLSSFIEQGSGITETEIASARAKVRYDDILTIQYTSGTTGTPKAVMSVHYKVLSNMKLNSEVFKYTKEDKILSSLPMYHVMGCFFGCLMIFMSGGCLVLGGKFKTSKIIEALIEEKCTSFHGVPTMYKLIMNKMGDRVFPDLNKGMIAGSYCDAETMQAIITDMGIKNMFPSYGQSEGCGYTQTSMEDSIEKIKTTVGRAIDGVEIKIVDDQLNTLVANTEGEILVKSEYRMSGYYKDEAATNKGIIDGWIHTGDLGKLDEEGYLKITGRKKDIIIRGGENISPVEIECILKQQSKIKDAVVVGIPDDVMGQEIAAFIIGSEEEKKVEEDLINEIAAYVAEHLPKHKQPRYIRLVDKFPLTGSGKIQKFKLVELI